MAVVIAAAIAMCVARPDLAGLAMVATTAAFPPAIGFALFQYHRSLAVSQ